jgi:hypothetical protein
MEALANEVRARGGRPYVIPESGAGELGALGYVECAVELSEQIHHGAPRFDTVVITAGSGGSHAGLLMGKQLAGLPGEIVSVPATAPAEQVREAIARTVGAAIQRFGFAIEVPKAIHLLDGYQGAGAAGATDEELGLLVELAREEGLLLDPVYTAKGFRGLVETLARDPKALGQRVCFIHTGGLFSLFPFRDRLSLLCEGAAGEPSGLESRPVRAHRSCRSCPAQDVDAAQVDLGQLFRLLMARLDVIDPIGRSGGILSISCRSISGVRCPDAFASIDSRLGKAVSTISALSPRISRAICQIRFVGPVSPLNTKPVSPS